MGRVAQFTSPDKEFSTCNGTEVAVEGSSGKESRSLGRICENIKIDVFILIYKLWLK